jgi:hypothetical protein
MWAFVHRCVLVHSPNTTVPSSISKGCMVIGQLSQLDLPFLSSVMDSWPVMMIGQLESSVYSSELDS